MIHLLYCESISVYLFICLCIYLSQDIVRKIEQASTDSRDRPQKDVVIVDSGAETVTEPFSVSKEDATEWTQGFTGDLAIPYDPFVSCEMIPLSCTALTSLSCNFFKTNEQWQQLRILVAYDTTTMDTKL